MKGNYFYELGGHENCAKAFEFYKQALALDSTDARVWSVLAGL